MSEWIVRDTSRDTERTVSTRSEAEEKRQDVVSLGADPEDIEIIPPDEQDSDTSEPSGTTPDVIEQPEPDQLPESPSVDEDPLDWMPSDFTDEIDGTVAINRKGYDVLAHHYDISVETEIQIGPHETDHTYCQARAVARTRDGTTYTAHGSAHVDRGDDAHLLVEMADTRAAKRATARATGVGMVAVEELQNEL